MSSHVSPDTSAWRGPAVAPIAIGARYGFRYLINRIEKIRHARADWDELVVAFKTSEAKRVHPLRTTLKQ
jgi:hypothetical protein